jgi:hypothetical protein
MKRMALFGLLLALTVGNAGCCFLGCGGRVQRSHHGGCMGHRGCNGGCPGGNGGCPGGDACADGSGGMPATVTYPYYTTRGPRDFFACNPGHPHN